MIKDVRRTREKKGSASAVALIVIAFAAIHSVLASRMAKKTVARLVGERTSNGVYRFGFVTQSVATTVVAVKSFLRLPDRTLYEVKAPFAILLWMIQILSLALLGTAVGVVGLDRISGVAQLQSFARGETPEAMPEAQGPPVDNETGQFSARGPFRYIRHPDNLPIITLLWSFPRMTVNRLTLAVLVSIYAVLGSWHEDSRLRSRYGKVFETYLRKTPLFLPRTARSRSRG